MEYLYEVGIELTGEYARNLERLMEVLHSLRFVLNRFYRTPPTVYHDPDYAALSKLTTLPVVSVRWPEHKHPMTISSKTINTPPATSRGAKAET